MTYKKITEETIIRVKSVVLGIIGVNNDTVSHKYTLSISIVRSTNERHVKPLKENQPWVEFIVFIIADINSDTLDVLYVHPSTHRGIIWKQ